MDSFTEGILERARERQKKLLEYKKKEMPLNESNNKNSESTPQIISPQLEDKETQKLKKKDVVSDSNINNKTETDNLILKETTSEGNLPKFVRQNSKTFVSSEMPGSPQSQFKTLNIHKENFNMEIKLSSTDNVRLEVQFQEEEDNYIEEKENILTSSEEIQNNSDDDGDNTAPVIRENAKKKLQQLGKLYAGGEDADISSPIHRSEPTFLAETNSSKSIKDDKTTQGAVSKLRKGLGGLAALAQTINEWDTNTSVATKTNQERKPVNATPKKSWKPPAPRPPLSGVQSKENSAEQPMTPRKLKNQAPKPPLEVCVTTKATIETSTPTVKAEEASKHTNFDPTLLETLQSQGFTRTSSKSALVYNYNAKNLCDDIKTAEISSATKTTNTQNCIVEENEESTSQVLQKVKSDKIKTPCSPSKNNIKGDVVASKAALFENASNLNKSVGSSNKDPALLSISERKALFEKNKGAAPVPKAPISMATPLNVEKNQKPKLSPTKVTPSETTRTPSKYPAPRPPIIKTNDNVDSSSYRIPPGQPGGIASKLAALFDNKIATISQQQIENNIREQRQKEMDVLLNRFQKNKQAIPEQTNSESEDEEVVDETTAMIPVKKHAEILKKSGSIPSPPPPPPPGTSSGHKRRSGTGRRCSTDDSPKVVAVLDDVKRIKVVSPSKPGRLYPCLSDIETATETEAEPNTASPTPPNSSFEENSYESDAAETSFGREILETVCKNHSASSQKRPIYDESTESDVSGILDEMDDYLDEAMAYQAESGPTPPKQGRLKSPEKCVPQTSSSFQYKNFSPQVASSSSEFKSPLRENYDHRKSTDLLPTYVVEGDNLLPLTHTVSFYRKQQNQDSKTPIRQVVRHPGIKEEETSEDSATPKPKQEDCDVKNKIRELLEEMTKQQTIISQTSQALNLCYSTPEFTGSIEQVEAEKVLLLATHRRAAAQREMEKLTVLKTLHPENSSIEKGTLTISNIVLPLKREYVRALNATGGKGHHVVCLIKCADKVLPTKLVSTVATNDRNPDLELRIPDTVVLKNIYSDFTVQFEVYCLQAQEEILPHEVKYHINNKKSSNKLTPKKSKPDSRLVRPVKESPGGPQAVRSPTFALMGYVIFSIQAIKRKNWTLNNTPSMSPLEGIVEMRVKCELMVSVEQRGFLTMFEDISGFGAWHRRWCLLKNNVLSYWKYPDDERKKAPIDSIDLKDCITQQVGLVRRDICARPNTILIETTRPAQTQDKDSLVMECNGDITVIRHLLAADTKEERIEWCSMFNKSLNAAKVNGCTK